MENCYITIGIIIDSTSITKDNKTKKRKKRMPVCLAAANRIIERTNAQNEWRTQNKKSRIELTGKRLQKLLYLCQLFWYIDHEDSSMITEDFEAWPNGPVIPQIYDYFKIYQDGDMSPLLDLSSYKLNEEETKIINSVVDSTINISTEAIIDFTHRANGPWAQAYDNSNQEEYRTIPKDDIKNYIRSRDNQEDLFRFILGG